MFLSFSLLFFGYLIILIDISLRFARDDKQPAVSSPRNDTRQSAELSTPLFAFMT